MSATMQELGIDQLSVDERIELVQAIWDSISPELHPPFISEAQRRELDARLAAHEADPTDVVPWEQIKSDALARFGAGVPPSSFGVSRVPSSMNRPTGTNGGKRNSGRAL